MNHDLLMRIDYWTTHAGWWISIATTTFLLWLNGKTMKRASRNFKFAQECSSLNKDMLKKISDLIAENHKLKLEKLNRTTWGD